MSVGLCLQGWEDSSADSLQCCCRPDQSYNCRPSDVRPLMQAQLWRPDQLSESLTLWWDRTWLSLVSMWQSVCQSLYRRCSWLQEMSWRSWSHPVELSLSCPSSRTTTIVSSDAWWTLLEWMFPPENTGRCSEFLKIHFKLKRYIFLDLKLYTIYCHWDSTPVSVSRPTQMN